MKWLRDLPIRRRLTLVIVLTCTVVLLIACGVLAAYELNDYRRTLVRDTTVLADILSKNTRAALAFQDETAAEEILGALQSEPHVVTAILYTAGGERFAAYARADWPPGLTPRPATDGPRFEDGHLTLFHPVVLKEKRIGTLYMRSDLQGIYTRLGLFAGFVVIVLMGSLLLAFILSTWLQRPISGPILALAETAQSIASQKDYSVRAPSVGKNELGVLTDAFNEMVTGIQQRETALRTANEALLTEIGERKHAENRVQAQLARLAQLHQITRATGERQDLKSIFQVVVRSLEDHLPVDFTCICLYDENVNTLSVASIGTKSVGFATLLGVEEQTTLPVDYAGFSQCVRGRLIYEPDLTGIEIPFPQRIARGGLSSLVIAPLLVESKVFGVLLAARRTASSFSSSECEFLRQLGEHVALAAHQAQLYGALQQAYDDLRQTQQAVMQQERLRALGQMASGIAHDINNAISPVTLYTESLLETEPGLSTRAREYLTTIQRSMDDVTQTVSRMREFYRQREAQLALHPVDINSLVYHVLDLTRVRWRDIAQENGVSIELKTEMADELPPIRGVESEIREALTNLVLNAIDAMPQGGNLILRTRVTTESRAPSAHLGTVQRLVIVEVADTGVGMDEDTRRRCLEPFFTTKGERGTGLGLAMVYGTIQRHSADIEIDSAVGKGTCMRLIFPAPVVAAVAGAPVVIQASIPIRMRMLIVDDDPLIIKSLRDILEGDGHEVVTANGGQAGIMTFREAQAAGNPFALVITDLGMPYVDGRKVAGAVKAASPETPVIMLTGWGQRMASEGDIPTNVDRVLSKPPKLRDLRAAFASLTTTTIRSSESSNA
jgi:signal transduction histidine kinase/ActR/RegA family two-component response regulator/HAMP domain-containing protein